MAETTRALADGMPEITYDWACVRCGARMIQGFAPDPENWAWQNGKYRHSCPNSRVRGDTMRFDPARADGVSAMSLPQIDAVRYLYVIAKKYGGHFHLTAEEWNDCPPSADVVIQDKPFIAGSRHVLVTQLSPETPKPEQAKEEKSECPK